MTMINMNVTTIRARVVTLPNGGTRVRVFANGHQKTMAFNYGASDQHTQAIYDATGIHPDRLVEISRTLDGRRYHVEPRMSEAYELGVDTYDRERYRAYSTARHTALTVLTMTEPEDIDELMSDYDELTASGFSDYDAFLSILATITEGQE